MNGLYKMRLPNVVVTIAFIIAAGVAVWCIANQPYASKHPIRTERCSYSIDNYSQEALSRIAKQLESVSQILDQTEKKIDILEQKLRMQKAVNTFR